MTHTPLIVKFGELPRPIKLTTIAYVSCVLGYNVYGTYKDSLAYLRKYRENKLNELATSDFDYGQMKRQINSDWDAVKYGA